MSEEIKGENQTQEIVATLDVASLKAGLNPTGLDPDLEIKAEEYAKRSWQLEFEPVLSKLGLLQDVNLVANIQNEIFNTKYAYLVNANDREIKAKEAGLRWGLRS